MTVEEVKQRIAQGEDSVTQFKREELQRLLQKPQKLQNLGFADITPNEYLSLFGGEQLRASENGR